MCSNDKNTKSNNWHKMLVCDCGIHRNSCYISIIIRTLCIYVILMRMHVCNSHRLSEMARWVVSSPCSFWPIKLNLLRIIYLFLSFIWLPLLIENILIKIPLFVSFSHTFLISSHLISSIFAKSIS